MLARRLLRGVAALTLVFVWVVLPAPRAWACDCGEFPSLDELRDRADVVFTGELVRRDDPLITAGDSRLQFAVDAVHKGTVAANQVVVTPGQVTACGLNIAPGGPWLIFADRSGLSDTELSPDEVYTSWCHGSSSSGAPAGWPQDAPGPATDTRPPVPPVVWWASGAGLLLVAAGVIMVHRRQQRRP